MSRTHLFMRLDANQLVGEAHAIRSAALLAQTGLDVELELFGAGDRLATYFPGAKIRPCLPNDHGEFLRAVATERPGLVWVDHPYVKADVWQQLNRGERAFPIICIDDFGGEVQADLVFNGTVLEEYHRYPRIKDSGRVYAGGKYSLLRPSFAAHKWSDPALRSVTVVAGSGDQACAWILRIFSGAIDISGWGKVRAIVGRTFPQMDLLSDQCKARGVILEKRYLGDAMAKALSASSVALITGGMIVYEAVAAGVPAIVFPNLDNLVPEANWFSARACIENLGPKDGMDAKVIARAVESLMSSAEQRQDMSRRQNATIDGLGLQRVGALIRERILGD